MIARYTVVIGCLCLSGCAVETAGPTQHEVQTLDLDQSESVRVNLDMGAGELRVGGGTQKLLRADFTYNVPSAKPYLRYSSNAGHGDLSIEQPKTTHAHVGDQHYEWDLKLNRDVPLDVRVHLGAAHADLDLGSLNLHSVDVEMGVGELQMDLRGTPKHDYSVQIRGGVGEAVVRVPAEIGVEASARGGIGDIQMQGMRQDGQRYYNDAYERSKVRIHLDVEGGVGSIKVISE